MSEPTKRPTLDDLLESTPSALQSLDAITQPGHEPDEIGEQDPSRPYRIIKGSGSAHCCFRYTVVDTHRDDEGKDVNEATNTAYRFPMCECFDLESAREICRCLNAAWERESGCFNDE